MTVVLADRLQFAFTIMFHYLFPITTMGLAPFVAYYTVRAARERNAIYADAARFWTKIFTINFAVGVVSGIPMEFQFGTNWAAFSTRAGSVVGQPLAMEGVYAFFLESIFLGALFYAQREFPSRLQATAAVFVWLGSWLSGFFIVVTDGWMQHPVGYVRAADGTIQMGNLAQVLFSPFAIWQYLHVLSGALVTGGFVVAGIGAYYLLSPSFDRLRMTGEGLRMTGEGLRMTGEGLRMTGEGLRMTGDGVRMTGRNFVRSGVIVALVFSMLSVFPTGDRNGANVTEYQPIKLAAMEGLFESQNGAPLAIIGMPDTQHRTLIDPIEVPDVLSFLAYGNFRANVKGLTAYATELWPPVELTYYAYHVMVGLGTIFVAVALLAALMLLRGRLYTSRPVLWLLLLAMPFPYIANEAGWVTTEVGRQPWIIYGIMRTSQAASPTVAGGEAIFTLIGFAGMYFVLGVLFLYLVLREIGEGPGSHARTGTIEAVS